ncbi:MAG: ADOP family duplicated permease [Gemmatimonadota bacterium]
MRRDEGEDRGSPRSLSGPGGSLSGGGRENARERERRELREEMESHMAHRADDLQQEGLSRSEAEARARAEFGDPERIGRAVDRERRRIHLRRRVGSTVDGLRQDLTYAFRQILRTPGFATVAILTLALGLGAAVTILSFVRAVVLEPLPFAEPDRLVELEMLTPEGADFSVSEPAFLEWRDRARGFTDVAAIATRGATLQAPGTPVALTRGYLNAGALELLGVRPTLGRTFRTVEDAPGGAAPVVLISEALWQSRFGGGADALGRSLRMDGSGFEVVGVFPPALSLLVGDAQVVTPLAASPAVDRGDHHLTVVARRGPEVDLARAREEIESVAAWQSETYVEDRGWSATLTPIRESLIGPATTRAGWVLLGAAGLLLAMACVNVSSLLLARASTRADEMGVRAALGAGRGRLARQLLTESGVLAACGGAMGVGMALLALPVIREVMAGRLPRVEATRLDPTILLWTLLSIGVATFLFGSAPVLALKRQSALIGRSRGGTGSGTGVRRVLVAVQVGASLVLLLGTGLLFRSFLSLARVDPGFQAEGAVAVRLLMPDGSYDWRERGPLVASIVERVEEIPGVIRAGATSVDPFSGTSLANFVARADRLPDRAAEFQPVAWRAVTPGFFEAMDMPFRAGRPFADADLDDGPSPVVIDERLATRLWDRPQEAVGATLVWGDPGGSRLQVVGVVGPLRDVRLDRDPEPMIYRLHQEIPWAAMTLVARVRTGETGVGGALRAAVADAAPGLPVPEVRGLQAHLDRALAAPRFNVGLLAGFAAAGLLLALVGLYGLTAFEVRQRFREIGIRISLGARPAEIRRRILKERLALAAAGIAGGMLVSVLLSGLVSGLLFEVEPTDPWTWAGALVLLVATTALAAWIPTRKATRVHPRDVLNAE